MMAKLAIKGGKPVRDAKKNPWPVWPCAAEPEKKRLLKVLDSGVWSYNGPQEQEFTHAFAKFCGSDHAVAVANGTVSLQLALEALDLGPGDEVIVPGLTWQATAGAVIDINAVPVLVDVDPDSWCIDPASFEAAVTPRTRAVIPVHLYGCICNMDEVLRIAKKRKLAVIEDCAHQPGSVWKDKPVGSIGDMGSFSFQLSKVITAGEGGAVTTSKPDLYARLDGLRNCGRRPAVDLAKGSGQYAAEGDFIQSGNYRITEFQAAVLIEQLKRAPAQIKKRDHNAIALNAMLAQIHGITPMKRDPNTTLQSYFNFAFRFDGRCFKGLTVKDFRAALDAELGITAEPCYVPLNNCSLYRPLTKKRYNLNPKHWRDINPAHYTLPACWKAHLEESVCVHHSILLGGKKDIEQFAAAVAKIRDHVDELVGGSC
jgi:L-glutamine:2-deoxy-scyllo-inosose/3-amino-2,3-dideoxy-scyllo-inosose aminotransferase